MKPLHASLTRLNRCPCCHSQYSREGMKKKNDGKSAARKKAQRELQKELRHYK